MFFPNNIDFWDSTVAQLFAMNTALIGVWDQVSQILQFLSSSLSKWPRKQWISSLVLEALLPKWLRRRESGGWPDGSTD